MRIWYFVLFAFPFFFAETAHAAPCTEVREVKICTDKTVRSITGSVVEFTDGSAVNTVTGAVHNRGHGYLVVTGKTDGSSFSRDTKGNTTIIFK